MITHVLSHEIDNLWDGISVKGKGVIWQKV